MLICACDVFQANSPIMLAQFISTLNEHRNKVEERLQAEREQCGVQEQELATILAQIEEHKAAIAKQELTPSDVHRMNAER